MGQAPTLPELKRPVGIVHRKRKRFNRATQSFLELSGKPEPMPSADLFLVLLERVGRQGR